MRDAWRELTGVVISDEFSARTYVNICRDVSLVADAAGMTTQGVEKAMFVLGQRATYEKWLELELQVMRRLAGRSATAEEIFEEVFGAEVSSRRALSVAGATPSSAPEARLDRAQVQQPEVPADRESD